MTFEALRERQNLSVSEAAALLGIHPQAIWRYEKQHRVPKPEVLEKMSVVYSCTDAELGQAIMKNIKEE